MFYNLSLRNFLNQLFYNLYRCSICDHNVLYCLKLQVFNTNKSCHSKVLGTICQFNKTTTTCAMISFTQFFHGLYIMNILELLIDKKPFINTMPFCKPCKYIPNVPILFHTINIISFDLYCLFSHSKSDKR